MDTEKDLPEFAIAREQGIKVADVVWCSDGLWRQIKHEAKSPVAHEICVKVLSSGNTAHEMLWLCAQDRTMQFFSADGAIECSLLVPTFPKHLEL